MDPFIGSDDFRLTQNKLGTYISLSVWTVSFVFCFYYFAMGIPLKPLLFLGLIALIGILSTRLFQKNKNALAITVQCLCMYLSLICVLHFPVIGKYTVMCVLIIELTPVILLNHMYSSVVFMNVVASLLLLSVHELTGYSDVEPLERILDFFIKLMVLIIVFIQVYGLRLLFERRLTNINHKDVPRAHT